MTSVEVYHSQPWFPGITSSSMVGAAAVVDTFIIMYPTGGILLCLKKVKGKDFSTFGNKTANIYVKKLTSSKLCVRTM